jgi:tetratricopeptide (TPR) repeat protein
MHEINIKFRAIYLMMFLIGLNVSQASAVSLRDRVLNDVSISQSEQYIVIQVAFNFPVRYLRHYPLDYGKELNIQLKPILAGIEDLSGLMNRESLSAPDNNPAGLVQVQYEGNELLKPTIRIVLDKARNYEARQGDDFRSLLILLPVETEDERDKTAEEADKETTAPQQPGMLTPQREKDLLNKGVEMMAAKEYMRAILIYTKLLDSSDTEVRQFAQFELATAQEHKGHLAHARAEYKNYLKTYPGGENADQARERLNVLMSDRPVQLGSTGDIPGQGGSQWQHDYFGSISVYYDRDESLYQQAEDIENLSSLLTGFDATWRSRSDKYTAEAVAIGSYELSFLDSNYNRTRVSRLYIDFEDAAKTITSRVGRQSSSKGGVLTRFDGGRLGYLITDKIRINAVAGFPVNLPYDGLETDKYFYGINFDLGRFADHWDFNTYFINQLSDGIDDRRAVGGEIRFIGQKSSFYSLLDYDILYDDLTLFLFTGNYLLPNNNTQINFLADFRGVPILSTSNALIGQISPSLEALEETIGEDELRRLASDRTLDSSFVTVGISQPLTENIQIAGDISWSTIDGAPASGGVEAFESTGDDFYYSLQLIGSGIITKGDVSSVGLRYADTFYRDTYTFKLNSSYPFYDNFRISPRLQIDYRENKLQPGDQWRFIPGLRLEYTLARNWRFEIDGEYRYADKELEGIADGKDGYSISLGFRKDF